MKRLVDVGVGTVKRRRQRVELFADAGETDKIGKGDGHFLPATGGPSRGRRGKDAIEDARQKATAVALAAGARAGTIEVVEVEDVPLAYLPGNATRVRVKVVGELHVG